MPKPPRTEFRREDFPDLTGDRIDKLLRPLNEFFTRAYAILDRGLTFTDNVASFTEEITFTSRAGWAVRIKNRLPGGVAPKGVTVWRAAKLATSTETPVALSGVAWKVSGDQIIISDIGNVSADKKYRATLCIVAG
jgi:hypothetical protein